MRYGLRAWALIGLLQLAAARPSRAQAQEWTQALDAVEAALEGGTVWEALVAARGAGLEVDVDGFLGQAPYSVAIRAPEGPLLATISMQGSGGQGYGEFGTDRLYACLEGEVLVKLNQWRRLDSIGLGRHAVRIDPCVFGDCAASRRAIAEVFGSWSEALGVSFDFESAGRASIVVRPAQLTRAGGDAILYVDGRGNKTCYVNIDPRALAWPHYLQHELGHCFGASDTAGGGSIMDYMRLVRSHLMEGPVSSPFDPGSLEVLRDLNSRQGALAGEECEPYVEYMARVEDVRQRYAGFNRSPARPTRPVRSDIRLPERYLPDLGQTQPPRGAAPTPTVTTEETYCLPTAGGCQPVGR